MAVIDGRKTLSHANLIQTPPPFPPSINKLYYRPYQSYSKDKKSSRFHSKDSSALFMFWFFVLEENDYHQYGRKM